MPPLLCAASVEGPALGAAAGVLCGWFVGVLVLPVLWRFLGEEAAFGNLEFTGLSMHMLKQKS